MKNHHAYRNRKRESGSALVYILIAIALLAALTVSFMQPSSQQTSSQSGFRTLTEVKSQIDVIRAGIQECVLRYPNGDQCINNGETYTPDPHCTTNSTVTDPGALKEYPINPGSAFYANATPGQVTGAAARYARNIRCPGANGGNNANHDNHKLIFSSSSGKFLPPAPDLFSDWQYYNGTDGVFFWISTDKSDSFLKSSMEKLDENFGECEADVIDNSASASALNLDVAGTVQCPARSLCFRAWMISRAPNAYISGSPERDASCPH